MNNMFSIEGKKAIVTGAAQGLAYGMAEGLMESGASVTIIDISPKTPEVVKEFNDRGFTCYGVVATLGECRSVTKVKSFRKRTGIL